jgi:AraC family transcriptional regulator of adaptative response/methylated-DNA-[protein]-cysteine methyltransferase
MRKKHQHLTNGRANSPSPLSFATLPPREELIRAIQERDDSYRGLFFVGVTSTRIFCRPGCPARAPLPKNMQFFATVADALTHGFRPCKRCLPMQTEGSAPSWLQPLLSFVEEYPNRRATDQDIRNLGVEPSRVRRYFHLTYGMTFHAFARSQRLTRALVDLKEGSTVDDASFDHGFESTSGFRDAFAQFFGTTPGKSGKSQVIFIHLIESPLGPLVAGMIDGNVCLLEFVQRRMLETQLNVIRSRFDAALSVGTSSMFDPLRIELDEYFAGTRRSFGIPLAAPGTAFQEKVWNALLEIPYGVTKSYEAIARQVDSPRAVRAVGTANGCNRIAILIPCHRVVNKNGDLGGYGGGLWRKKRLLELEQQCSLDVETSSRSTDTSRPERRIHADR